MSHCDASSNYIHYFYIQLDIFLLTVFKLKAKLLIPLIDIFLDDYF